LYSERCETYYLENIAKILNVFSNAVVVLTFSCARTYAILWSMQVEKVEGGQNRAFVIIVSEIFFLPHIGFSVFQGNTEYLGASWKKIKHKSPLFFFPFKMVC
jgi:hypothetical protein